MDNLMKSFNIFNYLYIWVTYFFACRSLHKPNGDFCMKSKHMVLLRAIPLSPEFFHYAVY